MLKSNVHYHVFWPSVQANFLDRTKSCVPFFRCALVTSYLVLSLDSSLSIYLFISVSFLNTCISPALARFPQNRVHYMLSSQASFLPTRPLYNNMNNHHSTPKNAFIKMKLCTHNGSPALEVLKTRLLPINFDKIIGTKSMEMRRLCERTRIHICTLKAGKFDILRRLPLARNKTRKNSFLSLSAPFNSFRCKSSIDYCFIEA